MQRRRFHILHSLAASAALVIIEALIYSFGAQGWTAWAFVLIALGGGVGIVVIATDAIREVRNADRMLVLLSAVMAEFIVFFAFQYWFLLLAQPGAFGGLATDPLSLLLNSTMIFALNPLYIPATSAAKALLLANTLCALGLVLFVLQNIWQFRRGEPA